MTVRIKTRAGGPFAVEGPITLLDAEGNPIDVSGRSVVLLCRCGASKTKPLCDGTHYRNGFESPPPEEPDPET
jgi:CDGSH-type Zn-finger protein